VFEIAAQSIADDVGCSRCEIRAWGWKCFWWSFFLNSHSRVGGTFAILSISRSCRYFGLDLWNCEQRPLLLFLAQPIQHRTRLLQAIYLANHFWKGGPPHPASYTNTGNTMTVVEDVLQTHQRLQKNRLASAMPTSADIGPPCR
jgi:hypothetical protein